MPIRDRRRTILWALLAAVAIGIAFGWFARLWLEPSPESRARDAVERMRERAHEFTR